MSVVPGGSFGQDPLPFHTAVMSDPQVAWMNPFIFFNAWKAYPIHGSKLEEWYCHYGKRIIDSLVDLPFALPTAVAGITLTTIYAPTGWIGRHLDAPIRRAALRPAAG